MPGHVAERDPALKTCSASDPIVTIQVSWDGGSMIASLRGRCVEVQAQSLIVDVNGVGYLVRATQRVIDTARAHPDEITVRVQTQVRDDSIVLYGFASEVELGTFEHLTALQGVGPKVAMAILGTISPSELRIAADRDDVALLQSVPGVGPKVARRIVTELKDKLGDLIPATITLGATVTDAEVAHSDHLAARDALMALGMGLTDAEQALALTDETLPVAARVKAALRGKAVSS